jgi:hypothetical protein
VDNNSTQAHQAPKPNHVAVEHCLDASVHMDTGLEQSVLELIRLIFTTLPFVTQQDDRRFVHRLLRSVIRGESEIPGTEGWDIEIPRPGTIHLWAFDFLSLQRAGLAPTAIGEAPSATAGPVGLLLGLPRFRGEVTVWVQAT